MPYHDQSSYLAYNSFTPVFFILGSTHQVVTHHHHYRQRLPSPFHLPCCPLYMVVLRDHRRNLRDLVGPTLPTTMPESSNLINLCKILQRFPQLEHQHTEAIPRIVAGVSHIFLFLFLFLAIWGQGCWGFSTVVGC